MLFNFFFITIYNYLKSITELIVIVNIVNKFQMALRELHSLDHRFPTTFNLCSFSVISRPLPFPPLLN